MKKLYTFGAMTAATALIAAAASFSAPSAAPATQADSDAYTIPYYSTTAINTSTLIPGWTIIDNNGDGTTWASKSTTSSPSGNGYDAGISYNKYNDGDDYFISPKIHFEAGIEYVIIYNWKGSGSSAMEKLSVYLSKSNSSADAINADKILVHDAGEGENTGQKYVTVNEKVTLDEAGDYYVVFYFHSPKDLYTVFLADLLVAKNEFAPSGVTKLTATVAPDHELKCSLNWVLPTTDQFGATLTEDQQISAVKIYRDGASDPIATLDGTATSFDDTADTGLTSGKHTYGVSVVVNNVESPVAQVGPTSYVGPVVPFTVPVTFLLDNADDFNLWSQSKAANVETTNEWTFNTSYNNSYFTEFDNSSAKSYDSHLISPAVAIAEAGIYRIAVPIGCNQSNGGGNVRFEYAPSADAENMAAIGGEEFFAVPYVKLGAPLAEYTEITYKDVEITNPGNYNFAIHLQGTGSIRYFVKYLSVEKTERTPQVATNVTATAAPDESLNIDVNWTNPAASADGAAMAAGDFKVEIFVNDSTTPAATVTDGSETCRVAVTENGVYTITVKTVAAASGASLPAHPSATTGWVGSKTVALPYSTDFQQTDDTKPIWEAVDANADGKTFVYEHSSTYDQFSISSTKTFNDYLLSPMFDLTPGFYKITISHLGGSYSSRFNTLTLGVAKKGEFNAEADDLGLVASTKYTDFYQSSKVSDEMIINIEEAGKYQAIYGLNETTQSNASATIRSFKIEAITAFPDEVADLAAAVDGKNVTLTWTNPSKVYGTEVALSAIEAITIERDGEVIATLENQTPGAAASYANEDVPNGPHTYAVYPTLGGDAREGDHSSVFVSWVGGGASAPMTLSANSGFPGWYADGNWSYNENYSRWEFNNTSSTATHDDYLITCPINIKELEIYKLEFECSGANVTPANDNNIAIKMGTGNDHKAYHQVGTVVIPTSRSYYTFEKHEVYIAVGDTDEPAPALVRARATEIDPEADALYKKAGKVEAGDNRVAIHMTQPGDTRIRSFSFTKVAEHPYAATSIKEIAASAISFDGSTVSFPGSATVEVYTTAGACIASVNATDSFNAAALGSGLYIIKVATDAETATFKAIIK